MSEWNIDDAKLAFRLVAKVLWEGEAGRNGAGAFYIDGRTNAATEEEREAFWKCVAADLNALAAPDGS